MTKAKKEKKELTIVSFRHSLKHPEVYFDKNIDIRFFMPKGRPKLFNDDFHLKDCERKRLAKKNNH